MTEDVGTVGRRGFTMGVSGILLGAGLVSRAGVLAQVSEGSETLLWGFETDEIVSSSPTVVDDTVYFGSNDETVYAVERLEGGSVWEFEVDGSVQSSPTVVDGMVYVGSQDGNLYAVGAERGTEEWRFKTGRAVNSSPTVVDGTVYVGSNDETLYAVDAESGDEMWRFTETSGVIESSPTVADGSVYFGSHDGSLYAVDATDGTEEWTFETDGSVWSSPTVADGRVYVGSDDENLYGLDASSGEEIWRFSNPSGPVRSSPTVVNGMVYVGSNDAFLYAVDASDGEGIWSFETGNSLISSPTVADVSEGTSDGSSTRLTNDTVYVGSFDSNLYAVDASEGELRSAFETGDLVYSSPTVADGVLYFGSHDGNLYALDLGVADSSESRDSRVTLGTLGHHGNWEYAGQSIEPDEHSEFNVRVDGTNSPVTQGEVLEVKTAIENTGDEAGSRTVFAEMAGIVSDSKTVELDGGSSTIETFEIPTGTEDSGEYTVTVNTDDGSATASVIVEGEDAGTDSGGSGSDGNSSDGESEPSEPENEDTETGTGIGTAEALIGGGTIGALVGAYFLKRRNDERDGLVSVPWRGNERDTARGKDNQDTPKEPTETELAHRRETPTPKEHKVSYDRITEKERIGKGGNADVYEAEYEGEKIAVKKPRMSGTLQVERAERFMREAETWSKLDDHENIVSVLGYGSEPLPWIALEYMGGGDLSGRFDEMGFDEKLWTAIRVTEAVGHAHRRGVAHLDLKPGNVLFRITDDERYDVPKVSDWGLAKMLLDRSKSIEGLSPRYAAPEQFSGDEYGETDDLTDVYQLGTVFYEMFTGRPPFEGKPSEVMHSVLNEKVTPPSDVKPNLPDGLDSILLKALEKDREDRYETVIYLRDDLRELYESV